MHEGHVYCQGSWLVRDVEQNVSRPLRGTRDRHLRAAGKAGGESLIPKGVP